VSHCIYALKDPDDGRYYYVGSSGSGVAGRLSSHVSDATGPYPTNKDKALWILRLLLQGKRPELVLLEASSEEDWRWRERHWIHRLRQEGHPLANKKGGGESGKTQAPFADDSSCAIFNVLLNNRQVRFLEGLASQHGGTVLDWIREAVNAYERAHETGRGAEAARVVGNDPG
jgi:hypothetical protein